MKPYTQIYQSYMIRFRISADSCVVVILGSRLCCIKKAGNKVECSIGIVMAGKNVMARQHSKWRKNEEYSSYSDNKARTSNSGSPLYACT